MNNTTSTEVVPLAQRKRVGFVYIMRDERTRYYKIGFSYNPGYREKTLQSENPMIIMVFAGVGTMDLEKKLHERYDKRRIRGEWFELDSMDVDLITHECSRPKYFFNADGTWFSSEDD